MIPAYSTFVGLRYLLRRPIMILGTFGVLFAVWALLVVDGVFSGLVHEIRTDVRRGTPMAIVTDLPRDTGYEALRAAIEGDDAVLHTSPRLRHHGLLQTRRVRQIDIESSAVDFEGMAMDSGFAQVVGIDPLREVAVTDLRSWIDRAPPAIQHMWPSMAWQPFDVLAEPSAKRREMLQVPDRIEWEGRRRAGLDREDRPEDHRTEWPGVLVGVRRLPALVALPGDPVDLVTASFRRDREGTVGTFTVREPLAFAGYFASGHRMFDEGSVLVPIETLRTMLGHDKANDDAIDLVTDIALKLRPDLTASQVAAACSRLQRIVQARLPAGSPACSVIDWQEQNSVFLKAVEQEHAMMQIVLFVVMLVAGFVIYATLHMMVVQKWKDIGILAAIGGAPRGIGTVFVFCGLVVGATGALLGTLSGLLSVHYLNDINDWLYRHFGIEMFPRGLFDLPTIPAHLDPAWAVEVAVGAVVLSLVVATLPARKAARMPPVRALSYE